MYESNMENTDEQPNRFPVSLPFEKAHHNLQNYIDKSDFIVSQNMQCINNLNASCNLISLPFNNGDDNDIKCHNINNNNNSSISNSSKKYNSNSYSNIQHQIDHKLEISIEEDMHDNGAGFFKNSDDFKEDVLLVSSEHMKALDVIVGNDISLKAAMRMSTNLKRHTKVVTKLAKEGLYDKAIELLNKNNCKFTSYYNCSLSNIDEDSSDENHCMLFQNTQIYNKSQYLSLPHINIDKSINLVSIDSNGQDIFPTDEFYIELSENQKKHLELILSDDMINYEGIHESYLNFQQSIYTADEWNRIKEIDSHLQNCAPLEYNNFLDYAKSLNNCYIDEMQHSINCCMCIENPFEANYCKLQSIDKAITLLNKNR